MIGTLVGWKGGGRVGLCVFALVFVCVCVCFFLALLWKERPL